MQLASCLRLQFKPYNVPKSLPPSPDQNPNPLRRRAAISSTSARRILKLKSQASDVGPYFPAGDPQISGDLAPTSPTDRFFSAADISSLWIGLVVGVPSYYLAGSLVDLGMSWWQGIFTVFLANFILLVPLILTGIPGTKYGIPFPILARSSFGIHGAHIPTLLRALVGCGWYGIESWIGGEAVFLLLPETIKNSPISLTPIPFLGISVMEFVCFLAFWAAQLAIIFKGMNGIHKLEKFSAPILIILTISLLSWSYFSAGGFGNMLELTSRLSPSHFWSIFFPSLTANVSFWATLALNIPDFTRYAKSQKDQILGHLALPIFMALFTFVGIAVTSSTQTIFGEIISSPIELLGRIEGFWIRVAAILGISLATITTNIAANIVAPANALANISPSLFTFRRGALLTAIIGILLQPWRLLQSSESFVYTWLVGYGALLGPIGGVILSDYYLIKKGQLDVAGLYSASPLGPYYYSGGYNGAAAFALVVGIMVIFPGFLCKVGILERAAKLFVVAYDNAWFVGTFVSGLVYWLLSRLRPTQI